MIETYLVAFFLLALILTCMSAIFEAPLWTLKSFAAMALGILATIVFVVLFS